MRTVTFDIDEESISAFMAEDLLWHSEQDNLPAREALRTAAFYYMTIEQVSQYLGSEEEAQEYFV